MAMQKQETQLSPAQSRTIMQRVWENIREDATYEIRFKSKSGKPVVIREISKDGAIELYNLAIRHGVSLPRFEEVNTRDQVVEGVWICDIKWQAILPTGETWFFSTRGADMYDPKEDTLAVANRRAYGKARRNAYLELLPLALKKAFISFLEGKTGRRVTQEVTYEEEPSPATELTPTMTEGVIEDTLKEEEKEAENPPPLTAQSVLDKAKQLGIASKEIPNILGVTLTDWLARGRTYAEAIGKLQQAKG